MDKFDKLGVATCEDLKDLYTDDGMIRQIQSILTPVEYKRFKEAPQFTRTLIGQPLSALLDADHVTKERTKTATSFPQCPDTVVKSAVTTTTKATGTVTAKLDREMEELEKEIAWMKKRKEKAKKTETIEALRRKLEEDKKAEEIAATAKAAEKEMLLKKIKLLDSRRKEIAGRLLTNQRRYLSITIFAFF